MTSSLLNTTTKAMLDKFILYFGLTVYILFIVFASTKWKTGFGNKRVRLIQSAPARQIAIVIIIIY